MDKWMDGLRFHVICNSGLVILGGWEDEVILKGYVHGISVHGQKDFRIQRISNQGMQDKQVRTYHTEL